MSPPLVALTRATYGGPLLAMAQAHSGRFAEAEATIEATPRDCVACLTARGDVDTMHKQWDRAAAWFASAVKLAPSIPFAYADWGAMLLAKGDYDGAITKFVIAHQKGPRFADPLEMWGEALMQKDRSDLALAKFEEASRYAPNWGRLHLKWGKALMWTGDRAGAHKQFTKAAALELSPSDNTELARRSAGHD
jgi:tetratricopeptide (TPR) repeat protein